MKCTLLYLLLFLFGSIRLIAEPMGYSYPPAELVLKKLISIGGQASYPVLKVKITKQKKAVARFIGAGFNEIEVEEFVDCPVDQSIELRRGTGRALEREAQ